MNSRSAADTPSRLWALQDRHLARSLQVRESLSKGSRHRDRAVKPSRAGTGPEARACRSTSGGSVCRSCGVSRTARSRSPDRTELRTARSCRPLKYVHMPEPRRGWRLPPRARESARVDDALKLRVGDPPAVTWHHYWLVVDSPPTKSVKLLLSPRQSLIATVPSSTVVARADRPDATPPRRRRRSSAAAGPPSVAPAARRRFS